MPLLAGPMSDLERAQLARAARRLATLDFHPRPVRMRHVRILVVPWLFRLPWFRRFHGYEMGPMILLSEPLERVSNDLVTHELCHVWQDQHRRLYMWSSYLWQGYSDNEHEVQARAAVERTLEVG